MRCSCLLFFVIVISLKISTTQALTISGYGIKDLEGSDSASLQKEAEWWNLTKSVSSTRTTQTTSTLKWVLGGKNILDMTGYSPVENTFIGFERTYQNLPPHSFVGITGTFWFFDDMGGSANISGVFLQIDTHYSGVQLRQNTDFTTYEGGIASQKDVGRDHIKWTFKSEASKLTLKVGASVVGPSTLQDFGFRELHIHLSNYSGIVPVPDFCHISEDKNPLQWGQCSCLVNQAKDSSGNCVNCAANCDVCFGPADGECLACKAGAYWDGSKCNTCHLMCKTCTGTTSNECPTCKYGFYSYGNNTCMESCQLPFVIEKQGIDLFCKPKCSSSQFYFAFNESCLDSCDLPLVHVTDENNIKNCLNPCGGTNKFLYSNGSCHDTCKVPIVPRYYPGVKFCQSQCPTGSYLFSNGSCVSTCPFPLLSRSEPDFQYCWNPCPLGNYLFNNGSCESTCPAPLIIRSESGVKYCSTPCDSVNDFIYDNRSCENSCSAPLVSRTELLVARYCLNPCFSSPNLFLYPNGSCLTSCNFPLLNRTEPGVKYCESPCSSYIYPDGNCKNICPLPLMTRIEPSFKFCFTSCQSDQYLYSDQSCHDSCNPPLIKRLGSGDGIKYCATPCGQEEYVYSDGTCDSKCEYPYKILKNPSYKVCEMNADEIQTSQAHSLASATDVANTICGIGGLLTGFVTPGDPTSMLMWSLLKMLQFSKYMDVNFPAQLIIVFTKQNLNYNAEGYMSSLGRRLSESMNLGKFDSYGIPHRFLENYWQQLIIFAVLMLSVLASVLLPVFVTNPKFIKFLESLKSALKWNVVIMFFCGSYGDLVLYSAIEFQTASFSDFGSVMSFLTCLFMVLLAIYLPLKILHVINTLRKTKPNADADADTNAEKLWLHNKVFFEAYKSEQIVQHLFLLIYLIRVAFFNVIIGYIFKSPLAQALLINFLNFAMLIYLMLKSPIKDKLSFIQQVTIESVLCVFHLCLLILVIMDLAEAQAEATRAFFGGIMVVVLIVGPVATAILIVLKLFVKSRDLCKRARKDNNEKFTKNTFRFLRVRTRGKFVVGSEDTVNNDTVNINLESQNETKRDESPALESQVREENYLQQTRRILNQKSTDDMNLEKNLEKLNMQIYPKNDQNDLKRRKIKILKNRHKKEGFLIPSDNSGFVNQEALYSTSQRQLKNDDYIIE